MKTDVLVLGGGLSGLSTAHHLGVSGALSCLVAEAKATPGGTAGSVVKDGFTFDYTGHLLHLHDPYGTSLVQDLLEGNLGLHERRAAIFSQGVLTRYPFQANTHGLPRKTVVDCVAGFLETVHRPRTLPPDPDFISWSKASFGDGITRYFMRPYNEKLWQRPLSELTTDWQGRFVPKPSASEVLYGAMTEQNKLFGYNASFRYPLRGGIQVLADALAARLNQGVLKTGCRVVSVDLREKVALIDGLGEVSYGRLVNTLPLPLFLDLAGPLPAQVKAARRELRWNTVWNLNLGVARPRVSDKHWIYFPEKRYPFYRVGFSSNFSSSVAPERCSSLYIEVSRPGGARVDAAKLEASIFRGLRACGILKRSDEIAAKAWMPIETGYVVYDRARSRAVATIFRHLAKVGADSIGRYGGWKYSFMEEALLDGRRCAQRLSAAAAPSAGR